MKAGWDAGGCWWALARVVLLIRSFLVVSIAMDLPLECVGCEEMAGLHTQTTQAIRNGKQALLNTA